MTMLEQLQAIDPAVLLNVVRQDQRSPDFEITDWTGGVLSNKGAANPDGLFCFSGHGRDGRGVNPWSVVLKILQAPKQPAPENDWWYWKRELPAYQSGFLARLPGPMLAPRCYGTVEQEGGVWIWMERVAECTPERWGIDHYAFAARQLGRSNGAYLTGTPLPDFPWLCRGALVSWLRVWHPEQGWDSPYVTQHLSAPTRERIMRLWADRGHFLSILNRLPQTFSHLDFHRRNLLIRRRADDQEELVAVDWAQCGIGPLGADLALVIGMSCIFFEWEPTAVQELEAATFEAYLAGLRDARWQGDPRLARLGYTAWVALWLGVIMSGAIHAFTADETHAFAKHLIGHYGDELASGWAALCEFALDRADEARLLMDQLKLA